MNIISGAREEAVRPLDPYRDLPQVADLIEKCFFNTMDFDGQDYLRIIRRAGKDARFVQFVSGANEHVSYPLYGYVYVENEKIVGNLTLIPFYRNRIWIYLIANVAVDPDYRRRGIARLLTQIALEHVKKRPINSVWLQVRDDNSPAYQLYLSQGFTYRCLRTNWQLSSPFIDIPTTPASLILRHPKQQDWAYQSTWLHQTYPADVSWNLPINFDSFKPGIWNTFLSWMNDRPVKQWAAEMNGELIGTIGCENFSHGQDFLWPAVSPKSEDIALQSLLGAVRKAFPQRQHLVINYPAGHGENAFTKYGFKPINTLIWMKINLGL